MADTADATAEAWEPASEVEARMRTAVRAADHEAYFRLLAQAELFVPVRSDDVEPILAGKVQPVWPTAESSGRTHILAYTSAEAMRATVGAPFGHYLTLRLNEIAEAWPDARWWLTVNAGLPIQGELPSWYVQQIAAGDTQPPTIGITAQALETAAAATAKAPAATEPTDFVPLPRPGQPAHLTPDAAANAAVPAVPADQGGEPTEPTEPATAVGGPAPVSSEINRNEPPGAEGPAEPQPAAEPSAAEPATDPDGIEPVNVDAAAEPAAAERPAAAAAEPAAAVRAPEAAAEPPAAVRAPAAAAEPAAAVRAPAAAAEPTAAERPVAAELVPVGAPTPAAAERPTEVERVPVGAPTPAFEPQNEVEEQLYAAAARDDLDAYSAILLGAQVLVPVGDDTAWGTQPDDPRFPWQPVLLLDRPTIVVFTSLRWMHEAVGECRFVMPKVKDLVEAWPNNEWSLAINPGTPVGAALTADQVHTLAGRPPAESAKVPPPGEFEPGNRIDQELFEAAEASDPDTFLRVLFAANVLVPIPDDAPLDVPPTEPGFRWDAARRDPSSIQVFTSLVRLKESLGTKEQARFVYADFRDLIGVWPSSALTMLLNPGTRIGASLAGDQVNALNEWAGRVGLLEPPSPAGAETAPDPRAETASVGAQAVQASQAGGSASTTQTTTPSAAPQQIAAPDRPTLMQKVLSPAHVSWYLDQGYDRVGGFVYPAAYTADLRMPAQLYETLGLLYTESPFSLDDDGVYVIRWPAYCEDMYRIPFGGRTEEELQGWGDSGWVIERPPFQGAGFAPGSAGTIREYKVDSTRLPHGAEMYYLSRDQGELFIASYDPDRLEWIRPPDAGGSPSAPWNGHSGGGQ